MTAAAIFVPPSILDTDLYKLSMQQAVLHHFPDVQASYSFTNRDKKTLFSRDCFDRLQTSVSQFRNIFLTQEEREWLQTICPYFTTAYLNYLFAYRFKPEQVFITFEPTTCNATLGNLSIEIAGPWAETILWEVPLMAVLSQCYFETVAIDWDCNGQEELAYKKGCSLLEAGCKFSEFGTRRRRSHKTQDILIGALIQAAQDNPHSRGRFVGTSNAYFAMKYDLVPPVGTIAHEWLMGVAALNGYQRNHLKAMELWEAVYDGSLLTVLTDTFTTEAFYKDYTSDPPRAKKWKTLRQDSGDPFTFGPRAMEIWASLDIDPKEKIILHSDALSVDKAIRLQHLSDDSGYNASFGIGTSFTNDFRSVSSGGKEECRPLNIVIKLSSVNGKPCIKLSDDLTKTTGDKATIQHVKKLYNIEI